MFASPLKTCPQSSATAGEPVDHPEPLEQLEGQPQRQAHHPEEVATDPLDQRRALALDRVGAGLVQRSEEHTSELQSQSNLVCRLLLEKKKSHTSSSAI